jgi:hypothetical protein
MVANIKPEKWDEYISILKPRGKIILVTAGTNTLGIPVPSTKNEKILIVVYPDYSTRIPNIWIFDCVEERNEFNA